jgi:hypothetical protein
VYVLLGRALHSHVEALEDIDPKMVRVMTSYPLYAYNLASYGAPTWVTKSYVQHNIIIVDSEYVIIDSYKGKTITRDSHLAMRYLSQWRTLQKTTRRIKTIKLIDSD